MEFRQVYLLQAVQLQHIKVTYAIGVFVGVRCKF